jgi:hypothetical protein
MFDVGSVYESISSIWLNACARVAHAWTRALAR